MADSTVSSLNSLYAQIYEDAIFVARETNLMAGLVTNYTGTGMAARNMGIYPQISAVQVAEGTDYANAIEFTKTSQMAITPYKYMAQVILTDERVATDPDDARQAAAMELGMAIGTKIDSTLVDLFSGFSSDKGTAGSALTINRCAAAQALLRKNNAPNPLNYVLHPYGWFDIWTELGQPAAEKSFLGDVANEAMRNFYVGDWLGAAMWFVDSNISIDGDADAVSAVFHREALALDTRQAPRLEVERDASKTADEINISVWFGAGERRDSFGVALTHDATEPS